MRTLELVSSSTRGHYSARKPMDPTQVWLLVHALRTGLLVIVLLISVIYQIRLGNFVNTEIWMPVYLILFGNFLLNSIHLFFFERIVDKTIWNILLFGIDTIAISLLIYFTNTSQSLFLFLYLVNLVLSGLVFKKEGCQLLAVWSSICLSTVLLLSPELDGQALYFSLGLNNLAFFIVAYLSGRLHEQLSSLDVQLEAVHRDVAVLQNLNELIVNNVATGLLVVNSLGRIQFANPICGQILANKTLEREMIFEIFPSFKDFWKRLNEESRPKLENRAQMTQTLVDGRQKEFEVIATPLGQNHDHVHGWLFIIDDRTEIKKIENQLRQQEKLAAVGQLAAGIAHEIRNPLASISGSVQLMLGQDTERREEEVRLMKIVLREIDRLNGLISEFLEYVRPETKVLNEVDLNDLVTEILEMVRFNPQLRAEVQQDLKLNCHSKILGSRDKLKQALLNIVINAYQAMEKTAQPLLTVETHDQGSLVILIVRDNGMGIKKEHLSRIFEPFMTTKPKGTGLGLALSHKILEAHDARMFVESTEGQGTRFLIEFPSQKDSYEGDMPRAEGA